MFKFEDDGPDTLPAVQSASAVAQDENVEMSLSVLVDGRQRVIRAPMVSSVADQLATALRQAAAQAPANKRQQ
jgi:hypothetical protein